MAEWQLTEVKPDLQQRTSTAVAVLMGMEKGDASAIVASLTPDALFWPPISAENSPYMSRPVKGGEAIAALFTRGKLFVKKDCEVEHSLSQGDLAAVHIRMIGQMANGAEYDACHLWLFRFDGDRICELWEYADTAHVGEKMRIGT